LLLIPGIGGHPRFHQPLIDTLAGRFDVHAAPHGDFFSRAYRGLEPHVDHWRTVARQAGEGPWTVVAVSFGSHLVPGLVAEDRLEVSHVVLLSPWLPGPLGRSGLLALRMLPERLSAGFLAARLMRWSESIGDRESIERLRDELYDARSAVAARWLQRLLAIRQGLDWPGLERLVETHRVTLVFGREERLYRLQERKADAIASRYPRLGVARVAGGHEIGHSGSPELLALLEEATGGHVGPSVRTRAEA
jgi:pimeloyl-ACP methyl ester carboxylesterase